MAEDGNGRHAVCPLRILLRQFLHQLGEFREASLRPRAKQRRIEFEARLLVQLHAADRHQFPAHRVEVLLDAVVRHRRHQPRQFRTKRMRRRDAVRPDVDDEDAFSHLAAVNLLELSQQRIVIDQARLLVRVVGLGNNRWCLLHLGCALQDVVLVELLNCPQQLRLIFRVKAGEVAQVVQARLLAGKLVYRIQVAIFRSNL